ncbi:MAG TPA: hypothetical protein VG146_10690 [Verrucomicrobiae bacterium]|nr:hypothetical protein [Verrucomicrobiae bacterium]
MNELLKNKLLKHSRCERRLRLWIELALCWAGAALLAWALIALESQTGWAAWAAAPAVAVLAVIAAVLIFLRARRFKPNWNEVARRIEAQHPSLDGRLLTAIQQRPRDAEEMGFLQQRVIGEALLHGEQANWALAFPSWRLALAQAAHWGCLLLLVFTLMGLRTHSTQALLALGRPAHIEVSPGDALIEKGNSLVVLARFTGTLPAIVDMVVDSSPSATHRIALVKSLADPMFGGSVPEVSSNLVYHIEYGGRRTRDFKVQVFEHPRLERADADLTFPKYTGQAPQHIPDTRRLSAVEGAHVNLALRLNKPVVSAELVARDKNATAIPLSIETNHPAASLNHFVLASSQTYELRLVDADGRTNKAPALFVFEVLKDRPPEIRITWPRGDVRPSPLEELAFDGTVWDDFGVTAYGLGYEVAGGDTRFVELGRSVPGKEKRPFKYLLRLEDLQVSPDELLSWFIWADDIGPDGNQRRTTSDLFFAEVRPFEEVFRQGQSMDGQSSGGAAGQQGNGTRLAQLQKKIMIATWKLQNAHTVAPQKERSTPVLHEHESMNTHPRGPSLLAGSYYSAGASKQSAARPNRYRVAMAALPARWMAQVQDTPTGPDVAPPDNLPPSPSGSKPPQDDISVLIESQAQALEQAKASLQRQRDPRLAPLWSAAVRNMEQALDRLKDCGKSPAELSAALTAERAAYQALLKVQQHEFQVMRNSNRSQNGGASSQQMQRELEQLDLTQPDNRYETERQAQTPQTAQRREQLAVLNRLDELSRRQQDLNDRLKELQTALQEARTEAEKAEIQRRLKRLQEEEQQMLADVDQLRQRMDRPENQSQMSQERQQLDQTRQDIQRASEAAGQGAASQALASGTRAQRQLQQMRQQMRKETEFSDDLRQLRNQARDLANQQQDLMQKLSSAQAQDHHSLSDAPARQPMLDQLEHEKQLMTNLVDRASRLSQEAEQPEPLLSHQLYDTVRKFSQDSAKDVNDLQDQLLKHGQMPRSLYRELKDGAAPDGAKLLDIQSEMLRQDFLPQAGQAAQRSSAGIDQLKSGIEQAANDVLGDDTEALRQAQKALDQATDQIQREMNQANSQAGQTNGLAGQLAQGQAQPAGTPPQRSAQARAGQEQGRSGQTPGQPNQGQEQASANGRQPGQGQRNGGGEQQQSGADANESQTDQASAQGATRRQAGSDTGGFDRAGANSSLAGGAHGAGGWRGGVDRFLNGQDLRRYGPLTGEDFLPWSDSLRDVEDVLDQPDLRDEVARVRDRARVIREEFKRDQKRPDWAVVRLQLLDPLTQVRDRIADELARRQSREALVPIDRDPVPNQYSDLVRRYYEELGKQK